MAPTSNPCNPQPGLTYNEQDNPPTWLQLRWYLLREWWHLIPERTSRWAAFHVPRSVAMWAFIRVSGHASTAQWGNERPDTMQVITCLERWSIPHDPQPPVAVDALQEQAW